MSDTTE